MNVFIKREYDYAIRITAYLAGLPEGEWRSVSHIAKRLFITRPFATKIVHQLKNENIIATVQGKSGGIYLLRPATEISVFDVLQAMGFNSTVNECLKIPQMCPLEATCKIHLFFAEQESVMLQNFKEKKIADFAFHDENLKQIIPLKNL